MSRLESPPRARRGAEFDVLHGVTVADPYRWLEDEKADDVKAWVRDQDAFARGVLATLPLRGVFAERLRALLYTEQVGIPVRRGGRLFFSRKGAAEEKATVFVKEGDAPPRVLLDPNAWSKDGSRSLASWSPSFDGKLVAYAVTENNSDEATLYVLDVATGENLPGETIAGAKYASPSWLRSGDGFYYTWVPLPGPSVSTALRPGFAEVRFHAIGTNPQSDPVIYPRTGDATTFLSAHLSEDDRWLFVEIHHGWTRNDIYVLDREHGTGALTPLVVSMDALYSVNAYRHHLFIRTNEGAPRYRVFRVNPERTERSAWEEIVAERADATLQDLSIVGGSLALGYLKDVVGCIELCDLDGKRLREVPLPTRGSASLLYGLPDDDVAYYSFESFTHPREIVETNVRTGETKTWNRVQVPVDTTKFAVEQLFATSKDGTRVPFFVVHAEGAARTGEAPTILYGYGGFQVAETPEWRASVIPWVEQGGVYVVSNLRGGSEYGEQWHREGMREKKQNVFDDFIAVAEELVRQRFTSPSKLAVYGGSNGGLLVGAVLTQRPDLFRVALCGVPLLDMIRYPLFGSGKTWEEEYGSPSDAASFRALHAYSPYHHVEPGRRYPSLLMLAADSDDRVDPMHARKMVAAVQNATSGGLVLLRVEKNAGHGGADLVRANVEKLADIFAFTRSEMAP